MKVIERVAETITRYNMFGRGARVGVAVSGGADSVCLLHLLLELGWGLRLTVLHVDHGLRGAESDADVVFVRDLSARLGLPFHATRAEVMAAGNLEEAAREERRRFLRGFVERRELDCVATGHTRNDQAETLLFRFLRGAGTAGLAGVRPVTSEGLVRPLLRVDRAEVVEYLTSRGIAWREDTSNASREFARNRIRHELLPALVRDWNPALVTVLGQTADWAECEEEYWTAELEKLAAACLEFRPPAVFLDCDALSSLPRAAARRLVRKAIQIVKGDLRAIEFSHIEAIVEMAGAVEGHGRMQAPGVDVFRSFATIRLAPPGQDKLQDRNYRFELPIPGQVSLPGGECAVCAEVFDGPMSPGMFECGYNEEVSFLDRNRFSGPLELRNWRPGDQYQPVGRTSEQKLKNLFQEARVPLWNRRHWPIITSGDAIVWARRFGAASTYAAQPDSVQVLKIFEVLKAFEVHPAAT